MGLPRVATTTSKPKHPKGKGVHVGWYLRADEATNTSEGKAMKQRVNGSMRGEFGNCAMKAAAIDLIDATMWAGYRSSSIAKKEAKRARRRTRRRFDKVMIQEQL